MVLTAIESSEMALEAPKDYFMPTNDYKSKHGCPLTNGLGHKIVTMKGMEGVLIPGEKVWTINRREVKKIEISQKIHETGPDSMQFGTNDIAERFADMQMALFGSSEQSTGTTREQVGGSSSSSGPAALPAPPPPKPVLAITNDDGDDGLFGGLGLSSLPSSFGFQAVPLVLVSSDAGAETAAGSRAKTKAVAKKGGGGGSKAAGKGSAKSVAAAKSGGAPPPASEGSAAQRGRGRPQRNLLQLLEQHLDDFDRAPMSSELWYGEAWKTNQKTLKTLLKDMKERKETIQDSAEFVQHQKAIKQLEAVISVLSAFHQYGHENEAFCSSYDEMEHFCKMAPFCDFPCPAILCTFRLERKLSLATSPREFWSYLDISMINEYVEDPEAFQVKILSQKVVALQKLPGDDFETTLAEFFCPTLVQRSHCATDEVLHSLADVEIAAGTLPVATSVQLGHMLTRTKDSNNKISNALTFYPKGRCLLAQLEVLRSNMALAEAFENKVRGMNAAMIARLRDTAESFRSLTMKLTAEKISGLPELLQTIPDLNWACQALAAAGGEVVRMGLDKCPAVFFGMVMHILEFSVTVCEHLFATVVQADLADDLGTFLENRSGAGVEAALSFLMSMCLEQDCFGSVRAIVCSDVADAFEIEPVSGAASLASPVPTWGPTLRNHVAGLDFALDCFKLLDSINTFNARETESIVSFKGQSQEVSNATSPSNRT